MPAMQLTKVGVGQRVLERESMEDLDEIVAYDRIARAFLEVLHQGFVETVLNHCPEGARILEVGTGTGWISIGLARADPELRIVATDLSAPMLDVARDNARREGVARHIDFRLGDAKRLPFADGSFDAVYCHNMLHHVEQPGQVLREMARVAGADGALLARDLVRVARLWIPLHVNLFGLRYSPLMKREYRDSIRAALSWREWRALAAQLGLGRQAVSRQFVTHQTLARPSLRCRAYRRVATSWLARLYVTRPRWGASRLELLGRRPALLPQPAAAGEKTPSDA